MNPWQDGLSALANHAPSAFILFFAILWGIIITRGILLKILDGAFDEADILSLSTAGWALPLLILSLITFAVSSIFSTSIAGILAFILILLSIITLPGKKPNPIPILISTALLIPILILRFAFIHDLLLPSYFDSAEHYRLIKSLFESYQTGSFTGTLSGGYYHLGLHHILAALAYFFQQEIIELMLVAGSILLSFLPFSFYFIVKRETDSSHAAWFAVLLAGFGFHMPAHLMNWGKYPALLGVFFIPFVLSLGYILHQNNFAPKRKTIFFLLALALLISTLIHSRTLVLYSLLLLAALLTSGWERLKASYQIPGFIPLFVLLAVELFLIQHDPALKTLLDGYLKNDTPVLILLPSLILFSAFQFPQAAFFLLSWLALCILCLFIPITIPVHGVQTLLDRPFVQMFAFIPLSLLGGLGISGATRAFARLFPNRVLIQRFVSIFLFGSILLNAALTYDLYPSDCCRFVDRDDLAALTWLGESTPSDAKVLIASTGLYVTSFESIGAQTGVDAGIWISQLLSRPVELSGTDIQFDQADTYNSLCQSEVDYIYAGGTPQSFDPAKLESQPAWYKPAFVLPSAKVYQLTGCQ